MAPQPNMQSNLAFVEDQRAHVEERVYEIRYADIQYPDLVPVDYSADDWTDTVTYYAMDSRGKSEWIGDGVSDIPMVSGSMAQFESAVYMQGIGYDYTLAEINKAIKLGISLDDMKARAALRVSEEAIDRIALTGDQTKGMSGLLNYGGVPVTAAPNGAGGQPTFTSKTHQEIVRDVNGLITGIYTGTANTALADTVLLPTVILTELAERVIDGTTMTILEFIQKNNLYTMRTGQPLRIRDVLGLQTAGAGNSRRAMAYRRSDEVLKMHVPMPLQFLEAQISGLRYIIPGFFRVGGLDIRLPNECRYLDGI